MVSNKRPGPTATRVDLKKRKGYFKPGLQTRGILVSVTNPALWKNAAREVLNGVVSFYGDVCSLDEEEEAACSDFGGGLEKEVKQLRKSKQAEFIEISRGVGFVPVEYSIQLSASEIVEGLCRKVLAGEWTVRYATRLTPVDLTGTADSPSLSELMSLAVGRCFPLAACGKGAPGGRLRSMLPEDSKWRVAVSVRNMSKVSKEEVIQLAGSLVGERHAVQLVGGVIVMVEMNQLFCGVSVCTEFELYKKFNVSALQESRESGGAAPSEDHEENS